MGATFAHIIPTGMKINHSINKHRWKWMERSVVCFPPVNAWEPNVSRAVEPPRATHHPVRHKKNGEEICGITWFIR